MVSPLTKQTRSARGHAQLKLNRPLGMRMDAGATVEGVEAPGLEAGNSRNVGCFEFRIPVQLVIAQGVALVRQANVQISKCV